MTNTTTTTINGLTLEQIRDTYDTYIQNCEWADSQNDYCEEEEYAGDYPTCDLTPEQIAWLREEDSKPVVTTEEPVTEESEETEEPTVVKIDQEEEKGLYNKVQSTETFEGHTVESATKVFYSFLREVGVSLADNDYCVDFWKDLNPVATQLHRDKLQLSDELLTWLFAIENDWRYNKWEEEKAKEAKKLAQLKAKRGE